MSNASKIQDFQRVTKINGRIQECNMVELELLNQDNEVQVKRIQRDDYFFIK